MQIEQTLIAEKLNHLASILDDASDGYLTASLYAHNREFLGFKSLMEMMVYQYNSILAGFLKLWMLNSLRYHNQPASFQ
jgi:hypothetical protein